MLDLWLPDDDGDRGLSAPDLVRPVSFSESAKSLRDGFENATGGNFDGMLDAVEVAAGYSASPQCHAADVAMFFAVYSSATMQKRSAIDLGLWREIVILRTIANESVRTRSVIPLRPSRSIISAGQRLENRDLRW